MFANEDFDIDEGFLNDISQKESQYYSQTFSSDEESSPKKFKDDKDSPQQSGTKLITNLEKPTPAKSDKDSIVQNTNDSGGNKTVRKNLILERLKRNENIISNRGIDQCDAEVVSQSSNSEDSSLAQKPLLNPTDNKSRKTLILDALRRNDIKSISTRQRSPEEKRPTNLNDVASNNSKSERSETIKKCQVKPATTHKPKTLVRQFPGPAGLLPHLSGGIIPPLITESSFLSDSNDSTDIGVIDNTSMTSNYYSQSTENSFSEGPWRLLISDLSPDFLVGHEISSIKQKILTNSYRNNKVPFLAGVVQRVDLSCLNPVVVLKDRTGTIEGTICKDILAEYPYSLDIGTVLFLRNVGLVTIGSYLKKFHVIVGLKNILNIYTDKLKIFSISEMNARLNNWNNSNHVDEFVVNEALNSSSSSNSKFECGSNMGNTRATANTNPQFGNRNFKNSGNPDSNSDDTCGSIVVKESSAITNKHVDSKAPTTSAHKRRNLFENNHEYLNSSETDINFSQCDERTRNKSAFAAGDLMDFDDNFTACFLDIDDDLVSNATANVVPATNSKIETQTPMLMDENTVDLKQNSALNASHSSTTPYMCNEGAEKCEATVRNATTASTAKEKSNLTRISDIKLKLSVFRSDTELTPPPCEDLGMASIKEIHSENNKRVESSFASSFLLNETDSDEELFSQLDV